MPTINKEPIYTGTPKVQGISVTAGSSTNRSDGAGTIGTDMFEAFTAGTNGSYVKEMRIKVASSAASTAWAANVLRVYFSTATSSTGTVTSSTDTRLITEVAIPAITAGSTVASSPDFIVPLNFAIQTGAHLVANAGSSWTAGPTLQVTTLGGDY